jgi:hypothetical protein
MDSILVDGYRIDLQAINDPGFGPTATAAWMYSSIPGVGVRCEWTRLGAEVAASMTIWSTPLNVVSTGARYSPVPPGTHASREGGLPIGARNDEANVAEVLCGTRDAAGDHAALVHLDLERRGDIFVVTVLTASRWVAGSAR